MISIPTTTTLAFRLWLTLLTLTFRLWLTLLTLAFRLWLTLLIACAAFIHVVLYPLSHAAQAWIRLGSACSCLPIAVWNLVVRATQRRNKLHRRSHFPSAPVLFV